MENSDPQSLRIVQDTADPLTFHILTPLEDDAFKYADLADTLMLAITRRSARDRLEAALIARFEQAAVDRLMRSGAGEWLAARGGFDFCGSRVYRHRGPLSIHFRDTSTALLFKLTWL